eukprot:TRINITY_DN9564_c0_g1_i1.p1 TRINITY_DN9564_c0_g1~~TRINITY_DN9564_c0_g1_i1.p1  ORF type:complete len:328 (-),score=84.58 TRINITY_DN9564_c0_g1_i1:132-1046(-)
MLQILTKSEIVKGQSLHNYLIMPVQRIPRYVLLLQDLVQHTRADHPDHSQLVAALEKIMQIANAIDENKRTDDRKKKAFSVLSALQGLPKGRTLIGPHRLFIHEGDLRVIFLKSSTSTLPSFTTPPPPSSSLSPSSPSSTPSPSPSSSTTPSSSPVSISSTSSASSSATPLSSPSSVPSGQAHLSPLLPGKLYYCFLFNDLFLLTFKEQPARMKGIGFLKSKSKIKSNSFSYATDIPLNSNMTLCQFPDARHAYDGVSIPFCFKLSDGNSTCIISCMDEQSCNEWLDNFKQIYANRFKTTPQTK